MRRDGIDILSFAYSISMATARERMVKVDIFLQVAIMCDYKENLFVKV